MGGFSPFHLLILAMLCFVFFVIPVAAVALAVWIVTRKTGSNVDPCPDCGRTVSRMANACPHCGRPLKT
jgi:hypothetical protein